MSVPSELNSEVMGTIKKITEEIWPGTPVVPFMSPGATDGSALRNAGIATYGNTGLSGDMEDVRAHGKCQTLGEREADPGDLNHENKFG